MEILEGWSEFFVATAGAAAALAGLIIVAMSVNITTQLSGLDLAGSSTIASCRSASGGAFADRSRSRHLLGRRRRAVFVGSVANAWVLLVEILR